MKVPFFHESGPFAGIVPGDLIRVIYHGAPTALMLIDSVKQYSIHGMDGTQPCKITMVSPTDLRFYARLSEVRETVLRQISIVKIQQGENK
jgi:hypothetical protein